MGWCSATEIMDTAVKAAEALSKATLAQVYEQAHVMERGDGDPQPATVVIDMDTTLRPFVAKIAEALRDGDWDCIEEADAFDRFRQEMLGYDDDRMIRWFRDQLTETDDPAAVREYSAALAEIMERPH
jgi:hypothetical protein